jgi:hypothetical protein
MARKDAFFAPVSVTIDGGWPTRPAENATPFSGLNFSNVCPEHVLVNRLFVASKWRLKRRSVSLRTVRDITKGRTV